VLPIELSCAGNSPEWNATRATRTSLETTCSHYVSAQFRWLLSLTAVAAGVTDSLSSVLCELLFSWNHSELSILQSALITLLSLLRACTEAALFVWEWTSSEPLFHHRVVGEFLEASWVYLGSTQGQGSWFSAQPKQALTKPGSAVWNRVMIDGTVFQSKVVDLK
jgi:hypothetical protein